MLLENETLIQLHDSLYYEHSKSMYYNTKGDPASLEYYYHFNDSGSFYLQWSLFYDAGIPIENLELDHTWYSTNDSTVWFYLNYQLENINKDNTLTLKEETDEGTLERVFLIDQSMLDFYLTWRNELRDSSLLMNPKQTNIPVEQFMTTPLSSTYETYHQDPLDSNHSVSIILDTTWSGSDTHIKKTESHRILSIDDIGNNVSRGWRNVNGIETMQYKTIRSDKQQIIESFHVELDDTGEDTLVTSSAYRKASSALQTYIFKRQQDRSKINPTLLDQPWYAPFVIYEVVVWKDTNQGFHHAKSFAVHYNGDTLTQTYPIDQWGNLLNPVNSRHKEATQLFELTKRLAASIEYQTYPTIGKEELYESDKPNIKKQRQSAVKGYLKDFKKGSRTKKLEKSDKSVAWFKQDPSSPRKLELFYSR